MNKIALGVVFCVLTQAPSFAEVADSAAAGFTVKITTSIKATPAEVYRRLFRVGDWWSSAHTFSGATQNLSIEERPMGCFCEKLPNGGAVRHMEVVFLQPGKMLRLYGGLGPLQGMAVTGPMTFNLSPVDGGTKLEFTYSVSGYFPDGVRQWPVIVDGVLGEQITRFKSYVETGNPAGKKESESKQ